MYPLTEPSATDGSGLTSGIPPPSRGLKRRLSGFLATKKPKLIRSIAMTAALALVMPILPTRVSAQAVQYSILHSFGSITNDGKFPQSSVIQGSDGNLYGTAPNGGSAGSGTAFMMTPAGVVTILHSFGDGSTVNDGRSPYVHLIQDSDGVFYGTTQAGGSYGGGSVFKMTSAGVVTILHSFGSTVNDGQDPYAPLVLGSDGSFYGTTVNGGSTGSGTAFKMTSAGVVTILHSFRDGSVAGDGAVPQFGLIQGSDGSFYGITNQGGSAGYGTVFKMTPAGVVTVLHSFGDGSTTNDGQYPTASLVQGSNGVFYGTTQYGGSAGAGAVFEMTSAGVVTILHSFGDGSTVNDGQNPFAPLTEDSEGVFYGTTRNGGSTGSGTAFMMTSAGAVTILHSFPDGSVTNDGVHLAGPLIQGSDGSFYGTTYQGGSADRGTAFKISAPATHFSVSAAPTATAGSAFTVTVKALNSFNGTAVGYTGTVHFTSTDGNAVLPSNATLVNGAGTFSVTLKTAGSQTVTATDTTSSTVTGASGNITVGAASATHFALTTPTSATAGVGFPVTLVAKDAYDNTTVGYTGTVHFTSTDGNTILPADAIVTSGTGTFSVTLTHTGSQTVTTTDTNSPSMNGTSGSITVSAASATHFVIGAPPTATAGVGFPATLVAKDAYDNTATGYTGTVHFTSTDGSAILPADATLTSGTGTFSVTLKTAGSHTVTATDNVSGTVTGTSESIDVVPGAASRFVVTAPPTATAGVGFPVTVVAMDTYGNTATGYAGTVHFTSSDGNAVLSADASLVNGTGTFSATLKTAGSQTVTATDTTSTTVTGTSGNITVGAASVTHFVISAPSTATAGAGFTVTVVAKDAYDNMTTGYTGTVHFTSTDGNAILPADATVTSGTGTFSVTLTHAGSQTVTTTDTNSPSMTGTSGSITVGAASATHFTVSAPPTATAGVGFPVTLVAKDVYDNTATGYAGMVHFTSSDGATILPADASLANGTGTFSTTLTQAGSQTVTATDTTSTTVTGTSGSITVSAASVTHFVISAPSSAAAGVRFPVTLVAKDAYDNTAAKYTGAIDITSTDTGAVLPTSAAIVNGSTTIDVILTHTGSQTITAVDKLSHSLAVTSGSIAVGAGAASRFVIGAPATATAGVSFNVTIAAVDAYNNAATSYSGIVLPFTSSVSSSLSPIVFITNGTGTFSATLNTSGSQIIVALDLATFTIAGSSGSIQVSPAPATHFALTAPSTATAGSAISCAVTALDAFGNTASGYSGTAHFTSTDSAAVLPPDTTLTSGTGAFPATLKTVGSQTITATDTVTSGITGTSGTIAVASGIATHFTVSIPANATPGSSISVTVTALDATGNTATGYAGTVHFTSNDAAAALPANATLTNGAGTFSATINTAGSKTVTATDTTTSSITGTSNAIAVAPAPATHFAISAPANAVTNVTYSVTVTALDALNHVVPTYSGTARFTTSDGHAVLPANSTLTNGVKTFNVTMRISGNQTVTATDTVNPGITGIAIVAVAPAAPARFRINLRGNPKAGTPYQFTVQATDIFGNGTPGYSGTVHFTSTDGAATLPADATLSGGIGSFTATFRTVGSQTFTLTDTVNASITSTSAALTVAP